MARYLVEELGVDVNQQDSSQGWTPLHRAARVAHYPGDGLKVPTVRPPLTLPLGTSRLPTPARPFFDHALTGTVTHYCRSKIISLQQRHPSFIKVGAAILRAVHSMSANISCLCNKGIFPVSSISEFSRCFCDSIPPRSALQLTISA